MINNMITFYEFMMKNSIFLIPLEVDINSTPMEYEYNVGITVGSISSY